MVNNSYSIVIVSLVSKTAESARRLKVYKLWANIIFFTFERLVVKLLFIHSELLSAFALAAQTLVCQDVKFFIPWQEKEGGGFWCADVVCAGDEFTAALALKSSAIVYGGQFKIIRLQPIITCA